MPPGNCPIDPQPTLIGSERTIRNGRDQPPRCWVTGPRLDGLPAEIILEILKYLAIDYSSEIPRKCLFDPTISQRLLRTLRSLTMACKRLAQFSKDFQYYGFSNQLADPWLLLRSMNDKTELSRLLRAISWQIPYGSVDHAIKRPDALLAVQATLRRLQLPRQDAWPGLLDRESSLAALSLLVLQTQNIERLHIEYNGQKDNQALPQLAFHPWLQALSHIAQGKSYGLVHRFESLHTLRVESSALTITDLAQTFCLPSLRRVHLTWIADATFSPFWSSPNMRFSISHLDINKCYINSQILVHLIRSCQELKSFRYIQEGSFATWLMGETVFRDRSGYGKQIDFEEFGHALGQHKRCLEYIEIRDRNPDEHHSFMRSVRCLGSFRDFHRLKYLGVACIALTRESLQRPTISDKLPESLRRLELDVHVPSYANMLYSNVLQDVAASLEKQTPALKDILVTRPALQRSEDGDDVDPVNLEGLKAEFAGLQVDLQDVWNSAYWSSGVTEAP